MSSRVARRVAGIERTLIRRIFDDAAPGAINLGLGQPDLPTPSVVSLGGIDAIVRGKTSYTTTAGDRGLRAAVARRYPDFAAGPESVAITVGSQEALFASMMVLTDPGDDVLVPDPGYPAYGAVCRLLGTRPVAYTLSAADRFRLDPDEVTKRITERTRLVVLCSPSNPTGAIHPADSVRPLVAALERRGVAWIADEIYDGFVYVDECPSPSWFSRNGVVVSGLSKDMSMTGWRVGWVVGEPALVARVVACHQYLVTCAPSVSQAAASAALSPEGEDARNAIAERFRNRRGQMASELSRIDGIGVTPPDGAFYFFVDVSRFGLSEQIARRILERRKVIAIPGVAFGRAGEGYLRISFAASEEDIVRGIRAIGEELAAIADE